ncbi:hypothetical protein COCSUDRAFT_61272 [Coccomyxa subellipsoidea C-169]|uniref:Uncharacterized protein n=1 Tax=Coccomyxa subellipsoidea (strain C-169) TaxID=574566 RepID=I0Z304_COCSC|nr:hypothetical protein COCSUDRAFT_61272 [Coccomyxa subellipsoidea C-169]EIE25023.1 hypothetical protein COCSUDRAFT_61272 [Coccomyxa subellipsoidea C-169]|eukprot:XP_005649567.1 hypothetical protein COCSUDRAFT_61272 [Coccomyxa subellipsoidea C-169]
MGYPWVVRKALMKYGAKSTDIVRHKGSLMTVTTVNAKGSWTRTLDTEKTLQQRSAEGRLCKTTAFWDGKIHKSRMEPVEGSPQGRRTESWRFMDSGMMVVRSALQTEKGKDVVMFWYLEAIEMPERPRGLFGRSRLRRIANDQKRVMRATGSDNQYLRYLGSNMAKWVTPADQYISMRSAEKESRAHETLMSGNTSPRSFSSNAFSPFSSSPRAASGNAQLPSWGSAAGSSVHRESSASEARPPHPPLTSTAPQASDISAGALEATHRREGSGGAPPAPGLEECKTDSGKTDKTDGGRSDGARSATAPPLAGRPGPLPHPPPPQPQPPAHARSYSNASSIAGVELYPSGNLGSGSGQLGGAHHAHRRSLTNLSELGAEKSPESASRVRPPPESLEAQLSHKLQEYAENRSITSVVPVDNPLTTDEPELLEMSPEQAEETQLKLVELERELRAAARKRHEYAEGRECFCCTCVFHSFVIPAYVRTWDL